MFFIIQALHYNKRQVHFLSFIDKTMHKIWTMSVVSLGCLNVLVTSPMDFPAHLCTR
jgi:hypothetical protein